MFSRNKINARSQKCLNIFYGGRKEKKKIHVYNISAESVHKSLLQQRLISLSPRSFPVLSHLLLAQCCRLFISPEKLLPNACWHLTRQRRLVEKNREMNILSKMPVPPSGVLAGILVMGT